MYVCQNDSSAHEQKCLHQVAKIKNNSFTTHYLMYVLAKDGGREMFDMSLKCVF